MKKITNLGILGISLMLIGCANTYDIKPNYDENTKILNISGIKIKDANITKRQSNPKDDKNAKFKKETISYVSGDKSCKQVNFQTMKALHEKSYIRSNVENILQNNVERGKIQYCNFATIKNVRFFECKNINETFFYIISRSEPKKQTPGFKENQTLYVGRQCFEDILNHFIKMAKEDKIEIKKQSFIKK